MVPWHVDSSRYWFERLLSRVLLCKVNWGFLHIEIRRWVHHHMLLKVIAIIHSQHPVILAWFVFCGSGFSRVDTQTQSKNKSYLSKVQSNLIYNPNCLIRIQSNIFFHTRVRFELEKMYELGSHPSDWVVYMVNKIKTWVDLACTKEKNKRKIYNFNANMLIQEYKR